MTHSSACTCQQSLCETVRGFSAQQPDNVLYQTSLMSALLSGVYEGNTTIADLLTHGDFGLGTFNELDGELIELVDVSDVGHAGFIPEATAIDLAIPNPSAAGRPR